MLGPMSKLKSVFTCTECGAEHPKWTGQCPGCAAWNTIAEEVVETSTAPLRAQLQLAPIARLDDVDAAGGAAMPTGIGELDRVLGGGIVPGSVTLLGGEPGIGKSTLLMQVLSWWP